MADKQILNQAEINAAIAARNAAQARVEAANQAKTVFAEKSIPLTLATVPKVTAGLNAFIQALKSGTTGKAYNQVLKNAQSALSESKAVTSVLKPELTKIEGEITAAGQALANITIPAPIYGSSSSSESDMLTADAFALIEMTFRMYDLEELTPMIQQMMEEGVSPNRAALLLKTDPKYNRDAAGNPIGYQKRFYGNELRRQAGLNVISEEAYLALENSYSETLKAYGQANYFGTDKTARQAKMAQVIGGDVSAKEFQDRVILAVDRVKNSDVMTRRAFDGYYGINDNDLVAYFLNPKEVLPLLQEKVVSAEIGGAALTQGLLADRIRSEELAKFGVTKQSAQEGYRGIASVLPTATKLSDIYAQEGITYTQTTGEQEAFLGLESAKRAREKLISRELGTFSGRAGTAKGALAEEKFV